VAVDPGVDVYGFDVFKGMVFVQTGATAVKPLKGQPYLFGADVDSGAPGLVGIQSTMKNPTGLDQRFLYDAVSGDLSITGVFAKRSNFEALHPNGDYTFTLHCVHDGLRIVTLNLSTDATRIGLTQAIGLALRLSMLSATSS
jgi:hypothetical protein